MQRIFALLAILVAPALAQGQTDAPTSQPATSMPDAPATPLASQPAAAAPATTDQGTPEPEQAPALAHEAQTTTPADLPPLTAQPDERPAPPSGGWQEDLGTQVELFRRGSLTVHMGALIQVQGAFLVGDEAALQTDDPADDQGFRIRRARFGFSGQLLPSIGYYLSLDLRDTVAAAEGGDLGNELLDATITFNRYSFIQLAAGIDRVPFSSFALNSSAELVMIERPLMSELIDPGRRVGLRVSGKLGDLIYAGGVFNGAVGTTSGNHRAGLTSGMRLRYTLFRPELELEGLVADSLVPGALRIWLAGAYVFENGEAVDRHRVAFGLGAEGYRTRLLGELLWERSRPDDVPQGDPVDAATTRWGVAGQLGVFVWRKYLEVAARYEYYRDDDELIAKQQLISGGFNVYLCQHRLKLQANYVRRDERGIAEVENDIAFAQLQASF